MNSRELQKQETKLRITEAVRKLSCIYGMENLKVRAICKEADISIGTFYNYYDSIESILVERIVESDRMMKKNIQGLLTNDDEIANIETYIRQQITDFRKVPSSLLKGIFHIFIYRPNFDILEVNRSAFDLMYGMISRGQEKGQIRKTMETSAMTKMILKLIIGNCFVNCMHSENYDFSDTLVDEVKEILRIKE